MTPTRNLALTDRDREVLHAVWSLGCATSGTLRTLVSPSTSPDTFTRRLKRLRQHGHLVVQRYVAPDGGLWLYSLGPAGRAPGEPAPWRPGLAQVEHTLAVCAAVCALTRPGFVHPVIITGWRGEAELRAWAEPGAPFPDAAIAWRTGQLTGVWWVEVDRATESRAAWRRKLVRYLTSSSDGTVLALTTSRARAVHLAAVAVETGIPLLSTTLASVIDEPDHLVFDTRTRQRLPLSAAASRPGMPANGTAGG